MAETDVFILVVKPLWYVLMPTSEYDCAHSIKRILSSI